MKSNDKTGPVGLSALPPPRRIGQPEADGALCAMSQKSERIAAIVDRCRGHALDAHYLAYFECFNQGLFFEAHEVLEVLWLGQRQGVNGAFYKGLIQLAGAFVHLQKRRPGPARALFKLALANLETYPKRYEQLDLPRVQALIIHSLERLSLPDADAGVVAAASLPKLALSQ